jgi:uncharacterized membrane protein YoaK (UPF0700 family)
MATIRPNTAKALTQKADALTENASTLAQLIKNTVDSLIGTNEQIAQASSEVLCGVLGTLLGAVGGALLSRLTSLPDFCTVLMAAAGAIIGILTTRIITWRLNKSVSHSETVTPDESTPTPPDDSKKSSAPGRPASP